MCETETEIQWYTVNANSTITLMLRLMKSDDTVAVADDVESIAVNIYDITDGGSSQVGETDEPEIADCMYASLQTDSRWTRYKDSMGYTFAYQVSVPDEESRYKVVIDFTLIEGTQHREYFFLRTR